MLYIYRRDISEGATALANALNGVRYRALRMPIERKVRQGDTVVCWGEAMPDVPGVRILNKTPLRNKFDDAVTLAAAGVATVQAVRQVPPAQPAGDPAVPLWDRAQELANDFVDMGRGDTVPRTAPMRRGVSDMAQALEQLLQHMDRPIPTAPQGIWLPRANNHTGGTDLLTAPARADFFTLKEDIVDEYRIHSFLGRSIRAGRKMHREGFANPHAWIRSWDAGWRIVYDGVTARQAHRDLAHAACRALGLDFGAVDIGQRRDGSLLVLEVNRAPGLEGGTITRYANAIQRWMNGEIAREE